MKKSHRRRSVITPNLLFTVALLSFVKMHRQTITCFALFIQTASLSSSIATRRESYRSAFHTHSHFRQHQMRQRQEGIELHALFRPDGDSKKRTPLLRTATTARSTKGNDGKKGIKITGHKHAPSSSSSSVDKMRLDVMRSELSIKIAEDRVKSLEKELMEMTKKYNWAQSALRDRASTNSGRKQTSLKGQTQVEQQQRRQKHSPSSRVQLNTKSIKEKISAKKSGKNAAVIGGPSKKKSTTTKSQSSSTNSSFQGNTIDDLPPFAAGLFANAEREEKQRRLKLGIIEEANLDDCLSSSSYDDKPKPPSPPPPSSSPSIESLPPFAAGLFQQAEREEMEKRAKRGLIEESELSLSNNDDDDASKGKSTVTYAAATIEEAKMPVLSGNSSVVLNSNFSVSEEAKLTSQALLNNNSIVDNGNSLVTKTESENPSNVGGTTVTNNAEKELLSLRKQCAILSHKLSRSEELRRAQTDELKILGKSEKILRGLNADWTRRLSDARKEMDEEKAEWKKEYEEKEMKWSEERNGLEERLKALESEKQGLEFQLQNQSNITYVTNLFCDLLKERVACKLLGTKTQLFPADDTKSSYGQNETQTFVFSSPNLTWRRLRYGGKKNAPNKMLTVGGATEHRASRAYRFFSWFKTKLRRSTNATKEDRIDKSVDDEMNELIKDAKSPSSSFNVSPPPGLEPLAPLLVTKKRRLPKLYEKKSAPKNPSLVPKFLRRS